jgi:hypothetical protein
MPPEKETAMRHEELGPLYAVGFAVLIVGFVVGIAFANVSVSDVLLGLAVLACLVLTLFLLGRRNEADRPDNHNHHPTVGWH